MAGKITITRKSGRTHTIFTVFKDGSCLPEENYQTALIWDKDNMVNYIDAMILDGIKYRRLKKGVLSGF